MDSVVDVSVVADVSILLVDVMRRFSGDYLSDAQVADAVRAVDFPHIRDIVLSLDIVRDDHGSDEQVLELFLTDPRACRVGPNPHFDEAFYQLEYPDVRSSVRDNHLHCGFFHYIKYGMREGRWPNRPTKHIALHRGSPLPLVEDHPGGRLPTVESDSGRLPAILSVRLGPDALQHARPPASPADPARRNRTVPVSIGST